MGLFIILAIATASAIALYLWDKKDNNSSTGTGGTPSGGENLGPRPNSNPQK